MPVRCVDEHGREMSEQEVLELCKSRNTPEMVALQEKIATLENMDRLATHQTRYNKGRLN